MYLRSEALQALQTGGQCRGLLLYSVLRRQSERQSKRSWLDWHSNQIQSRVIGRAQATRGSKGRRKPKYTGTRSATRPSTHTQHRDRQQQQRPRHTSECATNQWQWQHQQTCSQLRWFRLLFVSHRDCHPAMYPAMSVRWLSRLVEAERAAAGGMHVASIGVKRCASLCRVCMTKYSCTG